MSNPLCLLVVNKFIKLIIIPACLRRVILHLLTYCVKMYYGMHIESNTVSNISNNIGYTRSLVVTEARLRPIAGKVIHTVLIQEK